MTQDTLVIHRVMLLCSLRKVQPQGATEQADRAYSNLFTRPQMNLGAL